MHRFCAAEKFIQEIFWRTYFKGWLEQRPQVWHNYRTEVVRLTDQLDKDASLFARYDEAVAGKTGINCFDAWARELIETGYLHNHARMWFASIWIFTFELPWQLGADFFLRHLLDGDAASNTLSWRWVAGLHTKGKTYLARAENIARYTNGRFDPKGQLAKTAAALTEKELGGAVPLSPPDAVPADMPYALLITEEDAAAETLDLPPSPTAVIGMTASVTRSPLPIGEGARRFTQGAISDALVRASLRFQVAPEQRDGDDWGALLVNWAHRHQVKSFITAYAPVGPIAERLTAAKPVLADADVRLIRISRPYDRVAWPHATRGFFGLKSKIPEILSTLGIAH
jgi:deoxyribodipyrimidine photo-lyase